MLKTMDGGTFWEARVVFLRMATAREQIAFIRSKCWANMTITVTAEELKELETALATHYHTLDLKLSNSVHLGGPNEGGIQQCIQRQQVGYLLDKLRLLQVKPSTLGHSLGKSILESEVSSLRADRRTWRVAA